MTCALSLSQLLEQGKLSQRPVDVIDWADVQVDETWFVGEGAFGRVFKGKWAGNAVAIKFLSGASRAHPARAHLQRSRA